MQPKSFQQKQQVRRKIFFNFFYKSLKSLDSFFAGGVDKRPRLCYIILENGAEDKSQSKRQTGGHGALTFLP